MQVVTAGFAPNTVEYNAAWRLQREWHGRRVGNEVQDVVLLLEHDPVYTAGKRTQPTDRPLPGVDPGAPVIDVDRGGRITWHGPGQLTGYPIVRLPDPIDVVAYVRRVEQLMIDVCADLGVGATRVEGRSGVWILADHKGPDRKVGAIGVRVSAGVTMHGFALNCDCDLAWFDRIVPCGITDASVTSLSQELGRTVSVVEAAQLIEARIDELLPHPAGLSRGN